MAGFDPFQDVPRAQQLASEGVKGYGETLQPYLMRQIGTALGGLNSIGALRSGGATQAVRDISTDYTNQIGSYAKQAAGEALSAGQQATELRYRRDEARANRRASLFSAIGGVLGAGIGFIAGGPAGAVAGAKVGSKVGG